MLKVVQCNITLTKTLRVNDKQKLLMSNNKTISYLKIIMYFTFLGQY